LAAAGPTEPVGEVRLRPECRPAGTLVVVGDVAEIKLSDEERAKKLAAVELFPTPGPGQRRFVRQHEIAEILELRSIDLADCRIAGANLIAIHGPERKAPAETPPAAATAATSQQPEAVVLAVAAARPLERGQVIQPDDVQLASFPANASREGLLHEVELAVGQEATRQFTPGQPLEARDLRAPVLVRRREPVRVTVNAPGVRLTLDAVAHEEGSAGDWVLIETARSREKIRARVCGVKQVEIHAGGDEPNATDAQ
jgi:flagella basal body P-ring formation protein FlgA